MQYHEPGQLGPADRAAAELLRSPPASLREAWHSQLAFLAPERSVPKDVLDRHFDEVTRHVAGILASSGASRPASPRTSADAGQLWPARLGAGFDLDLLVVEYAALRAAVTSMASGAPAEARDVEPERIGLAVDRAIAELGAAFDVTSTRLAFEASQREVKVREQLISIVSHDLRNLLTPMFVGAQVLSRLQGPAALERRVHRTAEGIQRSSQRMARLIDDLVDWGTIQAGKLTVSLATTEADDLLRESIELFRPVALDRGVRLTAEPRGELGRVVCDRDRVLQALSNLLSNALKVVGRDGSVRVGAERRPGELLLWVADDGPGLPSAGRDRLFERYWRGSEPGYKGTGLGLAITKGIVDAHGGRIWVDSEPGKGSTFTIALPDREPPADVPTD